MHTWCLSAHTDTLRHACCALLNLCGSYHSEQATVHRNMICAQGINNNSFAVPRQSSW